MYSKLFFFFFFSSQSVSYREAQLEFHISQPKVQHTTAVVKRRSKWWLDKCLSIMILGQTISALFEDIFEEVHMCHSRCASTHNENTSIHTLSTNECVCACACTHVCACVCVCVCVHVCMVCKGI